MSRTQRFSNKPLDVIGIGNAIVDILVQTDETFLNAHSLKKGSMTLVNESQAERLYLQCGPGLETSGGSAANTLHGVAQLGRKAGFIGRVKNDQLGRIFSHDIRSVGALFDTPPSQDGPPTARCLILVTQDAQRTMCTYLGASVDLEPKDLDLSRVKEAKILYLEGYLWDSPPAQRAFIKAAETSRNAGGQIALSLSDSFCVDRHRDSFLKLLDHHVDILFANEAEILSLYQSDNLNNAINKVRNICQVAAITCGEKGSVVIEGEKTWEIPSYKLGELIDTTGAGDLYAGGFLYGYTSGESLQNCGKMGSICAGQVVTQLGPRCQVSLPQILQKHLG